MPQITTRYLFIERCDEGQLFIVTAKGMESAIMKVAKHTGIDDETILHTYRIIHMMRDTVELGVGDKF